MKFARKMVLVPASEYEILKAQDTRPSKLSDEERALKLSQDMGKAIRLKGQTRIERVQPQKDPKASVLELSTFLPALYQPKARQVLSELETQGFKWNYNKEFTTPTGQTLQGSNIVDLIKEALVPERTTKPKPTGWPEFVSSVASSSVPKTLFAKKSTQRALQQLSPQWEAY